MLATKTEPTTIWPEQLHQQSFTWAAFHFILRAKEPIFLPPYKGSALRGGFGNSFRKVCCVVRNQECQSCSLNQSCAYAYIFETPRLENMPTQHQATNMPHPFVIEPPETGQREFNAGDELTFGLVLIGKSIQYLPYFVFAFDQLGRMGLGKGRGKFDLTAVYAIDDWHREQKTQVYDSKTQILNGNFREWRFEDLLSAIPQNNPDKIQLRFVTPTRILQQNKLTHRLPFELFARTVLRRISLLGRIHCGSDWELPYKEILNQADQTVQLTQSDLTWVDWERYSARQDRRMNLGGFVGGVTYEGNLMPFLSLIALGEFVHIGKNTSFGLGKYIMNTNL